MADVGKGMNRRSWLRGAAALGAAGAAGVLWRALDQELVLGGDAAATEPWRSWRGEATEGPLALVAAAVLAASPHNTQPWRFAVGGDRIELHADDSRHLGAIDPLRRELHLGLGCALENLLLAAGPHGFAARATCLPAGDAAAPVARIELASAPPTSSALYEAIPRRHTHRGPYRLESPIAASTLAELEALAADLPQTRLVWWSAAAERARFASATVAATRAIVADEEQSRVSHAWMRFDADEIARRRDGLTVDALGLPPLLGAVVKLLPAPSRRRLDAGWLAATEEVHTATAPLFGAVAVRDPRDRPSRLAAGRLWQRLQLRAGLEGIAGQPLSQLVERRDREQELGLAPEFGDALGELLGSRDWHAVLPFRLGIPTRPSGPSPRRTLESVVL